MVGALSTALAEPGEGPGDGEAVEVDRPGRTVGVAGEDADAASVPFDDVESAGEEVRAGEFAIEQSDRDGVESCGVFDGSGELAFALGRELDDDGRADRMGGRFGLELDFAGPAFGRNQKAPALGLAGVARDDLDVLSGEREHAHSCGILAAGGVLAPLRATEGEESCGILDAAAVVGNDEVRDVAGGGVVDLYEGRPGSPRVLQEFVQDVRRRAIEETRHASDRGLADRRANGGRQHWGSPELD